MKIRKLASTFWLLLVAITGFGQSVVTYPSSGTVATEEFVQNYVFDQMNKYVKADCDLKVTQIVQDGTAIEFGLQVSLQNINQYTVKVQKGEQVWWWYSVPYVVGERLRIESVPQLDSLTVTIRPTLHPTCYVSFGLNAGEGEGPVDPDPGTPDCPVLPVIGTISSITSTSLSAAVTGSATNVNWSILQSATVLRSGNANVTGGNISLAWNAALPEGTYTLKVDGVDCIGSGTKSFTIQSAQVPNCQAGPTLLSVYNITKSGLTAQFHGNGVTLVKFSVLNNAGTAIRTGQIAPSSAILNIGFSSDIAAGSYTLRLEGVNCNGFSTMPFTLTIDGGDPGTGDIIAKLVNKGIADHMDIVITGTGDQKKITDNANVSLASGYEFWYLINDKIVKQSTRLIDYPWPSNAPLGIMKFMAKIGLETLNKWQCPTDGYYDCEAAKTFSYNVSCAFTNIVFSEDGTGFDPSKQTVQWMDFLPDMPTPDSDVWVMPVGPISTIAQLQAKGVSHFSKYQITRFPTTEIVALQNSGVTYDEVPKTMEQLGLPDSGGATNYVHPPGTPDHYPYIWNNLIFNAPSPYNEPMTTAQGTTAGNNYPINHAVLIFENSEQYYAIGGHWPFWRTYYEALTARMQARFPNKWRVAHNYFTSLNSPYPAGSEWNDKVATYGQSPLVLGGSSRSQHKSIMLTTLSNWPPNEMLPGGVMEKVNSACYGIYLNAPDLTADNAYKIIYQSEVHHLASKYLFVFMQNTYEWNPNNLIKATFPEGSFYQYTKPAHNPAQAINYAFLSRVFADGFIPFGAAPKFTSNFRFDKVYHGNGLWFPNGATTPQDNTFFPYWKQSGESENFPTNGFEDFIGTGMSKYYTSFGQTVGGTRAFLRYRIDGGAWVEPQNSNRMHDVIDAYFDKRAIVFSEIKDGKMAVMYLNPYADGSKHTLTFQHPTNGTEYTMEVASTIVHEKLITL